MDAPATGALLGHYRILEQIGHGGMGLVFRARDEKLDRDVAVKILLPGTFPDDSAKKRFHREARLLAKLNHPNVAMAFDYGKQDGFGYLVTEYVGGITLDADHFQLGAEDSGYAIRWENAPEVAAAS